MSQLAPSESHEVISLVRPFSNFDFAETRFQGRFPIRRIFSQARSRNCATLVFENVPATGVVADENEEIAKLWPDFIHKQLVRLSFWKSSFDKIETVSDLPDSDCVGYALLKSDVCPSRNHDKWTIFESVMTRYEHVHNFSPCARPFTFRVGSRIVSVKGVIYCQQNGLNKACAQVALRSICATYLGNHDLSFSKINSLAFLPSEPYTPWAGFSQIEQIPRVLKGLNIDYFDFDYSSNDPKYRTLLPSHRILYSGIESGAGGLIVFKLSGPTAGPVAHMIPYFGHTFNEDTWAANAEGDYFSVGTNIKYIPSDSWLSSFIAHDDNFGSNLCIPKAYLKPENAQYAIALIPQGFAYNGFFAEVAASDYFYSILPYLNGATNPWMRRLRYFCTKQKLILRVAPVTKQGYLEHLAKLDDWEYHREKESTLQSLQTIGPEKMWMIELSCPDLFSTNLRKIGELLLDATHPFTPKVDFQLFVLARVPEQYLFFDSLDASGKPQFVTVPSDLSSHTDMLKV